MLFLITGVLTIFVFTLPKRICIAPLLIAAIHTTQLQVVPNFSILRIIILATVFRAVLQGSVSLSWNNRIDKSIILFIFIIAISAFWHHETPSTNPYTFRIRLIIDILGTYLASKAFLDTEDALLRFGNLFLLIIMPLSIVMIIESLSGNNLYAALGSNPSAAVRDGEFRASGPFATPILAGTIGALGLPFVALTWNRHRKLSRLGLPASLIIVISSNSSTPIGAALIAAASLGFWRFKSKYKPILLSAISLILVAQLFRDRPIWYLIALVDFVGGSTGWHRSYLIDAAINHISEWWLFGTDYTRHWMPYGLPSIPDHCDLTNYYIHLGVIGGLPLLLTLCILLKSTFHSLRLLYNLHNDKFAIWCYVSLFVTHAITFLTISYFDQTFVLFYAPMGMVSSLTLLKGNSSKKAGSNLQANFAPKPLQRLNLQ